MTLRDWLADLDDPQLAELLRNRPDSVLPLPPGFGSLAARLQLRASLVRALHRLTALDLAVLEAAADIGAELHPVTAPEVVERLHTVLENSGQLPDAGQVSHALDHLRSMAVIYGRDHIRIVGEAMPALPTNWQLLPEVQARTLSFAEATEAVGSLDQRKRKILTTLVASGGFGLTKDAAITAIPTRPIPELISAGLLARVDSSTVKLPAAVRRVLEGKQALPWRILPVDKHPGTADDSAGVAAGLEVVRLTRMLIDALGATPAATLKDGGLGVRAVSRLTRELGVDEFLLARLVNLAVSGNLLARGVPDPLPDVDDGGDYIAPTPTADEWLALDLRGQLAALLRAWWSQTLAAWLVGAADPRNKPIHLLSPAAAREQLPDTRAIVIGALSRVAPDELAEEIFYSHPIAAHRMDAGTVEQILEEARWIGAVAGGVTSAGLALLRGDDPAPAIDAPAPVQNFHVQGDLTIMVPGPLDPAMQKMTDTIAELESAGVASVYRITESSLRSALDTGLSTTDIESFLRQHSLTELPQSVTYLLKDIARRHGTLRGGPALCYLRSDDPAVLLAAIDAAPSVALRQIAPTVAISQAPLIAVVRALREAGMHPVAEDALGARLDLSPTPVRVPLRERQPRRTGLDDGRIRAAINALRREDAAAGGEATEQPTLAVLQAAARGNRSVTLGFVDKQGVAVHRVVKPLTVSAGQVDALDESTGKIHRFLLHRITEVIVD